MATRRDEREEKAALIRRGMGGYKKTISSSRQGNLPGPVAPSSFLPPAGLELLAHILNRGIMTFCLFLLLVVQYYTIAMEVAASITV